MHVRLTEPFDKQCSVALKLHLYVYIYIYSLTISGEGIQTQNPPYLKNQVIPLNYKIHSHRISNIVKYNLGLESLLGVWHACDLECALCPLWFL